MSNANDIKNLFAKFSGKPEGYRELALENDAAHSRARWPMLNAISPEHAEHPPGVTQASQPASRRRPYLGFGSVRQSQAEPGSAMPPQVSAPRRPSGSVPFGEPGRRQAPSSRGPDAAGAPAAPAPVAGVASAVTGTTPAPGPGPAPAIVRRAAVPDAVSPVPSADRAMPAREPLSTGAKTPRAELPSVKPPTPVQRTLRRLSQAASQEAPPSEPPAPAAAPKPMAASESGLSALFARLARR